MSSITSIARLLPTIAEAGQLAPHYYRRGDRLGTRLKADRSVVTAADTAVEALLRQAIGDCFPGVNILGEEGGPLTWPPPATVSAEGGGAVYDPQQPYTFVIDPIDGTLSFACGTPGWAICVGVLDSTLQPVAGIISAPSWDSLFVADLDPQSPATHNGTPLAAAAIPEPIDNNTTILIDSRFLQTHQVRGFPGKCRSFGSTALHMCLVAQQSGFALAHSCPVHIWDIAAAHAIVARVGLSVQYLDGQAVTYGPLVTGQPTRGHLITGHPAMLTALGPRLVPLAS